MWLSRIAVRFWSWLISLFRKRNDGPLPVENVNISIEDSL